jgi:DNA-directed RNA polymerase specialized sigma subunit
MIIGEIRRYLRDNNMIRVSRSTRDTAYKALAARDTLATRLSREATISEIVDEVNRRTALEAEEKEREIAKREAERQEMLSDINAQADILKEIRDILKESK